MASFPQGPYGSMPMYYPAQPGYPYPAYPTSWPPAAVHVAGPAGQPVQIDVNARPAQQPMMMQQLPVAMPYGYGAGAPQQMPQAQDPNANANDKEPEQEADIEEARYTMLAQYYKNPYYGLKAQLARAKADKAASALKAVDDKKSLMRYKQYLDDAMRDYAKDKAAMTKRERYWAKTAYKEAGIDEETIANEQKALAARKRQLLDTKDYLIEQRRTLREQMRNAGMPVKDDESDFSSSSSLDSSSSSSDSRSRRKKHHRDKKKGKGKGRKRSNSRGAKERTTRYGGRERATSHPIRASPPLFPTEPTLQSAQSSSFPLSSTSLAALPKLSEAVSHQRISEHLAEQQQIKDATSTLDRQQVLPDVRRMPDVTSPVSLNTEQAQQRSTALNTLALQSQDMAQDPHRHASLPIPAAELALTIPGQAEVPVMQIKFSGNQKQSFFLSASQVSVDAPNAFTQVLRDSQHKLKPGKTLKVPIQDHAAAVFTVIQSYLSGQAILPLSSEHKTILGLEHSEAQAYEILLKDARFYQLRSLQRALEQYVASLAQTRAVDIPRNPPITVAAPTPPPPPFALLDMTRKGQSIDLKDLDHLSVTKLSGKRLRKTLPRVRALVSGAALNFGARVGGGDASNANLQYSAAIPSTPLSMAWKLLSGPHATDDEVYFLEGEIGLKEAAAIRLNVDYADTSSPSRRRSSGLDEILLRLASPRKASWDKVLEDSFRFLQVGTGSTDATNNRSSTPVFGMTIPQRHRNLVNIPIASLIIDFTADKDRYAVNIREINTKTRDLEALDGYVFASPASR